MATSHDDFELHCSVCRKVLNDPRTLDCGHSFCCECLTKWQQNQPESARGQVLCPSCNKFKKQTSIGTACQLCHDNEYPSEANLYCKSCDKMFCDRCRQKHGFRFPKHIEVRLCDDHVKLSCPKHRNENLKHFCATCNILICTLCALDDSEQAEHNRHEVIPIEEVLNYCKEKLIKEKPMMAKELRRKKAILKESDEAIANIEHETAAAKDSIRFFVDDLISTINQWEDQEMACLEGDRQTCIKHWQKISQKMKEAGARTEKHVDLCSRIVDDRRTVSVKECIDVLKDVKNKRMNTATKTMRLTGKIITHVKGDTLGAVLQENFLHQKFYRSENLQKDVKVRSSYNYDEVTLMKKAMKVWEFSKVGHSLNELKSPVSVSFTQKNNIIISEVENRRVSVFDCIQDTHDDSLIYRRRTTLTGITPKDAVADEECRIFVADTQSKCVVVFDSDGHKITSWGEGTLEYPRCLALMSNNRIVVGDRNHHQILTLSRDGNILDRFGSKGDKNEQFQFIISLACDSKDRIIVGDRELNKVKVFEPNGAFLFSIDPMAEDGYCKPRYSLELAGVTVDNCDNIYIAVHGYHQIMKYNSEGGPVLPSPLLNIKDGIKYPCAVAAGPGGLVAIVESSVSQKHAAVKVFKV